MLKSAEPKEIRPGLTIRTTMLPAMHALRLTSKLGKIVAPAIAEAGALTAKSSLAELAPMFSTFFAQLEDKDIEPLVLQVFAASSAQFTRANDKGEEIERVVALNSLANINTVFEGALDDMIASLWHVLVVNFGGFINAAFAKFRGAAAITLPAAAPEPTPAA